MNILTSLQNIIKISPGRTAREYSQKLKTLGFSAIDKSTVNSALYRHQGLFEFCLDNDGAPRWFLKELSTNCEANVKPTKKVKLETPVRQKINLYLWQEEALREWKAQNCQGVIEAVTGAGKTILGLQAAIEQVERGGYVLVVVPSLELVRQWEIKIKETLPNIQVGIFGGGQRDTYGSCRILIATVNAARRYYLSPPDKKSGLLIADECHRYGSECNKEALDEKFSRRLGLSATYQRNDNGNADWLTPYFGEICFSLNYKRAISDGVVSEFAVALVGCAFSEIERGEYDNYSEKLYRSKKKLISEFDLPADPFGEFIKSVSILAEGGYGEGTGLARSYLSAFEKRRALLAESPVKISGLFKLLGAIRQANRTLIFTQTVASAKKVAEVLRSNAIDARAIHSQMKMDERRQILADFGNGNLQTIIAPQVLDEGIDVPEADLAIIIAASKTKRQMIQRMGRVLRRKQDNRIARFALLYIENTSEDPRGGAHDEFIGEIINVAASVKNFESRMAADKICRFLTHSAS